MQDSNSPRTVREWCRSPYTTQLTPWLRQRWAAEQPTRVVVMPASTVGKTEWPAPLYFIPPDDFETRVELERFISQGVSAAVRQMLEGERD